MDKGRFLELVVKLYFESLGFKAYLWKEWATKIGLPTPDLGVDLVLEKDGKLYAVQCKSSKDKIVWKDLGSFLAFLFDKNKGYEFNGGFIVGNGITKNAEEMLYDLPKKIVFIPIKKVIKKVKEHLEEIL